eukprot:CAMPEP_0197476514 /NCGR_PEP_ID=MMETSP1309-20131121/7771_1 /TAXON_ID=464262 /ORGANISM="Genus nov. species nov., Strain RCC998" /LENGTH=463 /DNA_ID=CAMNT_0043016777 /DNA_START=279 /DNA_END=1670 /DNA_ORIENTATION=-
MNQPESEQKRQRKENEAGPSRPPKEGENDEASKPKKRDLQAEDKVFGISLLRDKILSDKIYLERLAETVRVTVTSEEKGDYEECTTIFFGSIFVDGRPQHPERNEKPMPVEVGSFKATLVDRDAAGNQFHSACDAESGELQAFGCLLFGSSGTCRHACLKSDASAVVGGGFLYIDEFKIKEEYRKNGSTDIGAHAIRKLLYHDQIDILWSVAAYIGEGRVSESKEEILAAMAKDCRPFLRAGFEEIKYQDGGYLYLTMGMLEQKPELLSHEEALAIPMRVQEVKEKKQAASSMSTQDSALLEFVKTNAGTGNFNLQEVDRLKREGANPANLPLLHIVTAYGNIALFEPLIALGANINFQDDAKKGVTPLMIAAEASLKKINKYNRTADTSVICKLIDLGADKKIVDSDGKSCLGYYYGAVRNMNDFNAAMHLGLSMEVSRAVELLLTPETGATEADKECMDDH